MQPCTHVFHRIFLAALSSCVLAACATQTTSLFGRRKRHRAAFAGAACIDLSDGARGDRERLAVRRQAFSGSRAFGQRIRCRS